MSDHTPGPWRWEAIMGPQEATQQWWGVEAVPAAERVVAMATTEANARLIAAAPGLYSEAVRVVEWLERLAKRAEELAKDTRFETLAEANAADAKNYRASSKGIKAAIAIAEGRS